MSHYGFQVGYIDAPTTPTTLAAGNNNLIVLAASDKPLVISEILICNSSGSARTIVLNRYNGTTDYPILSGKSIPANDSYHLTFTFPLPAGWTLRATPSNASDLTVHVTYVTSNAR